MPGMTVVFGSKNGSTAEVAGWIAECLREHDPQVELAQGRSAIVKDRSARPDLVVIGGALYAGRWHRDAHRFLRRNRAELTGVPVAVFAMGPWADTEESWQRSRVQLDRALARYDWLKPVSVAVFGGVDPKVGSSGVRRDLRDRAAIERWADEVAAGPLR